MPKLIVALVLCSYAWSGLAQAQNPMRAPRQNIQPSRPSTAARSPSYPAVVLDAYVQFFQRVISPVDGARSNMYPTGSAYARQAFAKHGALLGLVLTTERLMHEGNEGQVAPRIRKFGIWRVFDPVEANDWWWQEPAWVYEPRPHAIRR
jgi:hypothetical protein